MRRWPLLGTVLLLSGCSGLGKFFHDTVTLPGQNPNSTLGVSENLKRARGEMPTEMSILPEEGNVWPGPPQPLPTLGDVERSGGLGGALGSGGPSMPRGGSMSMGEQNAIMNGAPVGDSFSGGGGGSLAASVPDPAAHLGRQAPSGSDIVIPNGDGTSTVIGPDGSVKTVKSAAAPK